MSADEGIVTRPGAEETHQELGLLDSILVSIRVISSIGAVVAITLGIVLAVQLFSFFRGLIDAPETVIASWQQAIDSGRPTVSVAAPDINRPEDAGSPVTESPAPLGDAVTPDALMASTSPPASEAVDQRPVSPATTAEDLPPYVALADRIMERLEVGEFSWLIGVGVLVCFCWLLLKIPVLLITAGTRLLLGLVNVSAE